LCHDTQKFVVGNTIKVWHDTETKSVKAWALFLDDRVDRTGFADTTFRFAASGAMKACSIGFLSREYRRPNQEDRVAWGMPEYGVEYTKSELLEWSPCAVPANPDAAQTTAKSMLVESKHIDLMRGKSLFPDDFLQQIEKAIEGEKELPVETTDKTAESADKIALAVASLEKAIDKFSQVIEKNVDTIQRYSEVVQHAIEVRSEPVQDSAPAADQKAVFVDICKMLDDAKAKLKLKGE